MNRTYKTDQCVVESGEKANGKRIWDGKMQRIVGFQCFKIIYIIYICMCPTMLVITIKDIKCDTIFCPKPLFLSWKTSSLHIKPDKK